MTNRKNSVSLWKRKACGYNKQNLPVYQPTGSGAGSAALFRCQSNADKKPLRLQGVTESDHH